MAEPLLQVSELRGRPGDLPVTLELAAGDRLALLGESGDFLRWLAGLSAVASGQLVLAGQAAGSLPPPVWRRQVVWVSAHSPLLESSVGTALGLPLVWQNWPAPHIAQRVRQWCDRLEIPREWLGRSAWQLNDLERQWVAIARALVLEPPVLLLDHALDGFVSPAADRWLARLETLLGDPNQPPAAMILATGEMELARRLGTRVATWQSGAIVWPGLPLDWESLAGAIAPPVEEEWP